MAPLIYRGLDVVRWNGCVRGWALRASDVRFVGEAAHRKTLATPTGRLTGGKTIKQLVDDWWRAGMVATFNKRPIDGVPWELHAIEDRRARNRAYASWQQENQRTDSHLPRLPLGGDSVD